MAPKVLVANRGEIAVRVLRSARELGWSTVAVYIDNDLSHAGYADEATRLESAADFLNVATIAGIASRTKCTHVHPGYGFLSEVPSLSQALASSTPPIMFIGPSPDTLRIASDKMLSRELATSLEVPVALGERVYSAEDVHAFTHKTQFPIMIKALDGGGGRGIRVVNRPEELDEAFKRCLGESPSKQVFVEKALTGAGWKHIEVQIIGDGTGAVNHSWERECSVQRRFQKIVETAPSRLSRTTVQPLIDASLTVARKLQYKGLGTFEYLINAQSGDWVFLEINPRVQVEHTITEEVMDLDLVRAQLLLFTPNTTLQSLSLAAPFPAPTSFAVQLRLTAEDPSKNFQLSPGIVRSAALTWPAGRGVRIDTWLSSHPSHHFESWTVGTEFDSLLAKIIARGSSFEEMTQKARRALGELSIGGDVKTNVAVLAGVTDHQDWMTGSIDTLWLERSASQILDLGQLALGKSSALHQGLGHADAATPTSAAGKAIGGGAMPIQPGSLFTLTLSPSGSSADTHVPSAKHTLMLSSIRQNAFPEMLSGTLQTSLAPTPLSFSLSQSTSASVSGSDLELADPNDLTHIAAPLTGKVVELHPALVAASTGSKEDNNRRRVRRGEPLVILTVMKMENTVVAPRDGFVQRVGKGVRSGVVIGEGTLICVVETETELPSSKL
ncbi:carboxylase:pyruvate/acetyl-coa/propionyl-CoA [Ephemerocybe angulata]|uniref:Carboxylase:pyruvate/acetyl-coa/propionyl-CoA n=1 Tax=Ephemerocybe angulata TaxID=980116 RepID=A0A8H6LW38_9AGAR|nr:carboxylase:pyruvate/acetyl-coa/propionyl-CoA [Tulosesus angulatus]